MPVIGPNTLGTIVILVAAILLIIVSASAPFSPNTFFLAANVKSHVSAVNKSGVIKMGAFGYCITTAAAEEVCPEASVGYALDPNVLLSLPNVAGLQLSDSVIRNLTKVLVLHALAAALSVLAFISGLLSHITEFSRTCWTSCLASLAGTTTLVAVIFDFIFFSGIRARVNAHTSSNMTTSAVFGGAIWLTLLAWVCLAFSGVFFCAGRCLFSCSRSRGHKKLESYEENKTRKHNPAYY